MKDEWKLGATTELSSVTLMKWIDAIRGKMEGCRMDSVFQILIENRLNKIYILEDWEKIEDDLVFNWINTLESGAQIAPGISCQYAFLAGTTYNGQER